MPMSPVLLFRLASLLVAAVLWGGCATVAPVPGDGLSPDERARVFRADLNEVRQRSWRTALDIVAAYEKIPADHCPGIAAFVRDMAVARRLVETQPGDADLDRLDLGTLVTRNPNFWRASLEIAPNDGSFLLLHATLLASGGEIWRANRVLMATTQLLPLETRTRPLYLAHVYGLGAIIMDSVAGVDERVQGRPFAAAADVYREGLVVWPRNGLLLGGLLDLALQEQVAGEGRREVGEARREELLDQVATRMPEEVARLHAVDPIAAASYRGDAAARQHGRDLQRRWTRLTDSDLTLDYKEVGELAAALEKAEAYELALVLQRLLVVSRGFVTPGDFVAWRRLLPRVVGEAAAEPLIAAWDSGEINSVSISGPADDEDRWLGDPAINALLRQQIEREIAERSFRIEMLAGQRVLQAGAYRERGVLHSRAGLHEAALADFKAAADLVGPNAVLSVDRAIVMASLGRDAEADTLLSEVSRRSVDRPLANLERAVLRFGQGRYDEAAELFKEEARREPESGYPALLAELAARRTGGSESGLIKRSRERVQPGAWVAACLRFVEGGLSVDELFTRAREGGDLRVAEQLSEAHFIVAQVELAAGNVDRGIQELEACIGTGMSGMIEYRLARRELQRLAPEREARLRQGPEAPADRPASPPALDGAPPAGDGFGGQAPA
jgi:lipoprotein NlpI